MRLPEHHRPARAAPGLLFGLALAIPSAIPSLTGCGLEGLARPARTAVPPAFAVERLHALLVNGGGGRDSNYSSHLGHLEALTALLTARGVAPAQIHVFSGDGADPAPDLATREGRLPAGFWLLPGALAPRLRPGIVHLDSKLPGFALRPARREELRAWFADEGRRLGGRDTLLLYVTDHGRRGGSDPLENTITLWGEALSVRELRDLLGELDPGVRVVMLMSQCYAGAFAGAAFSGEGRSPAPGARCGFFATTWDRAAYGCHPDLSRRGDLGHSQRLFAALGRHERLADAQREVLLSDRTPDVPLTTSGLFLDETLVRAASRSGREPDELGDALLAEAWSEPGVGATEAALLDRLAASFGLESPRTLAALERERESAESLERQLHTYLGRWGRALEDLREENLRLFVAAHPDWERRLRSEALGVLTREQRRTEAAELVAALLAFTKAAPEREARLRSLRRKQLDAKSARYRAQVRAAAALRLRAVLTRVAGKRWLERGASAAERRAFAGLEACEALPLGTAPAAGGAGGAEAGELAAALPRLAEERARLPAVTPSWAGVRYRPLQEGVERTRSLARGAVVLTEVLRDSPAAEAGLAAGDVVLGPPGAPFGAPHELREWIMQREAGAPAELRVLRGEAEHLVTLHPVAHPASLPVPH